MGGDILDLIYAVVLVLAFMVAGAPPKRKEKVSWKS